MYIKSSLLAVRSDLEMIKAARASMPRKISGEDAFCRRLNEAMAPSAAQKPRTVAGIPSDDIYMLKDKDKF